MLTKLYVFFNLLFFSHLAIAQKTPLEYSKALKVAVQEIDSLISYNKFNKEENKTTYWINQLNNAHRFKDKENWSLELKFRQALLLDRKDQPPTQVLGILQDISEKAKSNKLYPLSYHIALLIALCHEKSDNLEMTDHYLQEAYNIYRKHHLDSLYSTYCIRRSSYFRFKGNLDSTFYYAIKANKLALKYGNQTDLIHSHILLGFVAKSNKNYNKTLKHQFELLSYHKQTTDSLSIAISFNSIARTYLESGNTNKALLYNDSTRLFQTYNLMYNPYFSEVRYKIFESIGNIDSAYANLKQYLYEYKLWVDENERSKTKEIEERYQNHKKENIIKNKNQQLFWIIGLLIVISISTALIIRKNQTISHKNIIINQQIATLSKVLEQKQILLSELQHRVKNNLQHILSILEIQKESVSFNNIHELIRSNQNRIQSMALLNNKLNISENVREIDIKKYITELSFLVKESYDYDMKKVDLNVSCEVEIMSITKALPIGLIIVELISNSMKYAFKKQNKGLISIQLNKNSNGFKLSYNDNGTGFDMNDKTNKKGLGMEIIQGLIDQLEGTLKMQQDNGFILSVYFN